ncbi:MAG TPA: 2-polyprenylphenol 6-hydroxylase [Rhizomicrobium sp.]|jgi:ubiquinone biosynthesis protein|nr:2-polyprenylphenol 6-hydroxylase [Rhizomicrobium sp.]
MSTFSNMRRLWHAGRMLAKHDALVPREYLDRMPLPARMMRRVLGFGGKAGDLAQPPGVRLANALQSLGPAYIKLGQVLATRPDLVGDDIADALEMLQDRLPPFPKAEAVAIVAASLGKPVDALFASFGDAVAAASIAQVHTAETTDDPPKKVAVKVLRPGVDVEFARDLSAFAFAARMAERMSDEARRLRFMAVVGTLANSVALELDLRMEAAAASELAELTKSDADFRVPTIDWDRTAERVLTTEWIEGVPIRDPQALEAAGQDPKRIATMVVRNFLTQALRDGFFHADMHQGNLFVDADGRLVAVDFGIMGRLDPAMRRFMAETLGGFLARDYLRVAQVHYDAGFVPPSHPIETFAQALRAVGEPIFGRAARDVSMAKLLQQLFDTTRRFDMQLQPQLVLLQKTMVVVEGVARSLDPDFDIWETSRPVIETWMIAQVGPEARLRDMGEGVSALGRVAQNLPQLLRNAEIVSAMLAEGGMRLHPDTVRQIAEAQTQRTRYTRIAIWVAAGALGIIAAGVLGL